MKFWASFPKIYRFQQAKPIRKLTIPIGLTCWNWKIWEKLAHKFHVKLFLCFCRKSCPHLHRGLNANLNAQLVIAILGIANDLDLGPQKSTGFILLSLLTCQPNLMQIHTTFHFILHSQGQSLSWCTYARINGTTEAFLYPPTQHTVQG